MAGNREDLHNALKQNPFRLLVSPQLHAKLRLLGVDDFQVNYTVRPDYNMVVQLHFRFTFAGATYEWIRFFEQTPTTHVLEVIRENTEATFERWMTKLSDGPVVKVG